MILQEVRKAVRRGLIFSRHAKFEMATEGILIDDVKEALETAELVEDYPEDPRGHSCLLLGLTKRKRPIHVVCSPRAEGLIIITVYEPSLYEWETNYKMRRRRE